MSSSLVCQLNTRAYAIQARVLVQTLPGSQRCRSLFSGRHTHRHMLAALQQAAGSRRRAAADEEVPELYPAPGDAGRNPAVMRCATLLSDSCPRGCGSHPLHPQQGSTARIFDNVRKIGGCSYTAPDIQHEEIEFPQDYSHVDRPGSPALATPFSLDAPAKSRAQRMLSHWGGLMRSQASMGGQALCCRI